MKLFVFIQVIATFLSYWLYLNVVFIHFVNSESWINVESMLQSAQFVTKTGTTIVGVCCRDGIVLGADTRCTGGPVVIDKSKRKISRISSRIYCCGAGTSADCDQIVRQTELLLLWNQATYCPLDESMGLDRISSTLKHISSMLLVPTRYGRRRQSYFLLGGIDESGPALFTIDARGSYQRARFAALGSGSLDAISVLESIRSQKWRPYLSNKWSKNNKTPINLGMNSTDVAYYAFDDTSEGEQFRYIENVTTAEAIEAVRQAVRAGIMNDLGSGSHVDICVIKKDEVQMWRETMNSNWEAKSSSRTNSFLSEILNTGRGKNSLGTQFDLNKGINNNFKLEGLEVPTDNYFDENTEVIANVKFL